VVDFRIIEESQPEPPIELAPEDERQAWPEMPRAISTTKGN